VHTGRATLTHTVDENNDAPPLAAKDLFVNPFDYDIVTDEFNPDNPELVASEDQPKDKKKRKRIKLPMKLQWLVPLMKQAVNRETEPIQQGDVASPQAICQ
jgi:hypothetical protein